MNSFAQVIETLGGGAALGAEINVPAGTVRQWKLRDSIPLEHWDAVIEVARRKKVRGIHRNALHEIAAQKRAA